MHPACAIAGITPRTLQRCQASTSGLDLRTRRVFKPAHALSQAERDHLLSIANSPEYAHLPPSQFVPMLTDKGVYFASESTCYRVLRAAKQLAHRRPECPATPRHKPRALCATAPNQIYSWDITYLPTTVKGAYFYLYVFLDMVSNVNPYSEALFKILKYRTAFAVKPLETLAEARAWAEPLMQWYNHEHRHSGIQFVTPAQRHAGLEGAILERRKAVYKAAREANPARWSGEVRDWRCVQEVHLNPTQVTPCTETKMAA